MAGQGRHQHLETESSRSHFGLWARKKGSIRRKEPGIGGKPVMLVRRRVAHTAAPFILLVCGVAGVRLGAWRWMDGPVGSMRPHPHRRREREKRASRNQELLRSRPSPSGKGLLVRPPCGQLDICPCCAAQPASPTACLAACPEAARPPAPQQLCHVVLLRARARAKARADGRRGERAKRTPDRGGGVGKAEARRTPVPKPDPGQDLNWN